MRKSDPMEVVVYYPKTEEGWEELGKRVATAHATLYISCQFLKSLPVRSMFPPVHRSAPRYSQSG